MKWFHNPFRLVRVVGTFFRTGAVEQVLKITKVSKLIKARKVFMRLKELRGTKINSLIIYECNEELEKMDGLEILRS